MTVNIKEKTTVRAARNVSERIDKELMGAWRAGYEWVYIRSATMYEPAQGPNNWIWNMSYRVLPTEDRLHHNPFDEPMSEYHVGEMKSLHIEKYYDC